LGTSIAVGFELDSTVKCGPFKKTSLGIITVVFGLTGNGVGCDAGWIVRVAVLLVCTDFTDDTICVFVVSELGGCVSGLSGGATCVFCLLDVLAAILCFVSSDGNGSPGSFVDSISHGSSAVSINFAADTIGIDSGGWCG
tara:strand:- start:301 stop:720 length:420 start_codon:yes stop_codon:yes gene_type:complete